MTLLTSSAWADTLLLKNGQRLEGRLVSMDRRLVKILVRVKGVEATMTLKREDVASFKHDDGGGEKAPLRQEKTRQRGKPAQERQGTVSRLKGERVIFLVDHSGSMRIGERWERASEQVEGLVGRLDRDATFNVILFHEQTRFLFGSDAWMRSHIKSAGTIALRTAQRLREAPPELRAGTNLFRGLRDALQRRPTRIAVISDVSVRRKAWLLAAE